VTIKKGTTLTETCELMNKNGLTNDAEIIIQAEEYFPQSGELPTASSATATTLVDSSQSWAVDRFIDCWVLIVDGTGTDNGFVKITDSDATSITVASWPGTQPDNTSRYLIVGALIDGEGSRGLGSSIKKNTVAASFYGVGITNATEAGLYLESNFSGAFRYMGLEGNYRHLVSNFNININCQYSGLVNSDVQGTYLAYTNRVFIRYCGISDSGSYGLYVLYGTIGDFRDNFGDNNGTWGTYAVHGAHARLIGTECSGSSGNHSDPGTAGGASADQAVAY